MLKHFKKAAALRAAVFFYTPERAVGICALIPAAASDAQSREEKVI
jgi:hypothetical protein